MAINLPFTDQSKEKSDKSSPEGEHDQDNETDPKKQETEQENQNDPNMGENEEGHEIENPIDNYHPEGDHGDETDPKIHRIDNHTYPDCSWSMSSKGCKLHGAEPKDVFGIDDCQSIFHLVCQTEWEIYQYHLDHPNGDSQDCIYD